MQNPEDFKKFPILEKDDLRKNIRNMISSGSTKQSGTKQDKTIKQDALRNSL